MNSTGPRRGAGPASAAAGNDALIDSGIATLERATSMDKQGQLEGEASATLHCIVAAAAAVSQRNPVHIAVGSVFVRHAMITKQSTSSATCIGCNAGYSASDTRSFTNVEVLLL